MIDDDNYPEPKIEPTLLLKYLIEKSEELTHKDYAGFPLPFRALGRTVLHPFPEVEKEFLSIVATSNDPVNERAMRCKAIFIEALGRPHDWHPRDWGDEGNESNEDHSFNPVAANRFAWAARRQGEEMLETKEFQFISVWECMSFIAFQGDAEKLRAFEQTCLQFPEPGEKITQVIPLLWDVMRSTIRKN